MDSEALRASKLFIQKQIIEGMAFREVATSIAMTMISAKGTSDDLIDMITSAMAGAQQRGREVERAKINYPLGV
jgi:hypothetical protein